LIERSKALKGWIESRRFARRQQNFIAIAVAIYVAMWAVDRPASISATLLYTLTLCNIIFLMQEYLGFLYTRKKHLHTWLLFIPLLLVGGILGIMAVNAIRFPASHDPSQSLWQYVTSGWKMPLMATMIVGISAQLYRQMRERLESKNRELQQTIELEATQRELRGQELQQAREIQQSLLPKEIPEIAGFEIECAWEPAKVVGGDYFDVIRLSESKVGVCIADVVGKSVSAALLMANVQASVRAFAVESASPANVCSRVNSVLCSSISSGRYVTFFYGVLDSAQRSFRYSNAGHLLPVLIRPDGRTQFLENGGAVLGVFPQWKYEDSLLQLQSGDRIILFTDGITEAGLPDGEEFGEARLIESAKASAGKSTREMKSALLADVKRFCDSQLRDDATLVVITAALQTEGHVLKEVDELCVANSVLKGGPN
jgi:sigma-B regulation protein RsbU (phosphoserine phosphatase)